MLSFNTGFIQVGGGGIVGRGRVEGGEDSNHVSMIV